MDMVKPDSASRRLGRCVQTSPAARPVPRHGPDVVVAAHCVRLVAAAGAGGPSDRRRLDGDPDWSARAPRPCVTTRRLARNGQEWLSLGVSAVLDINLGRSFQWQPMDASHQCHPMAKIVPIVLRCSQQTCLQRIHPAPRCLAIHVRPAVAVHDRSSDSGGV